MKIITVIGARPQFIKAVALSEELKKNHQEILIHTGQHYDENMSDIFFDELSIPKPTYRLDLGGGGHGAQTGAMLVEIEKILLKEKPDLLLVYGDTNSTLAGALAAVKLHIPVAHVEAGLRSFNRRMPEETNRILVDHISKFLFAPSSEAVKQLKLEGLEENVIDVGDIMYDSILKFKDIAIEKSLILDQLKLKGKKFSLATIHRAENTDSKVVLTNILDGLSSLPTIIILPLHPRTKNKIYEYDLSFDNEKIFIVEPLGYLDMICLMSNAEAILTDSGGIQKEAYYLGIPCITLREQTEWLETVQSGWNVIVGSDKTQISKAYEMISTVKKLNRPELYGGGNTARRIRESIDQMEV